MTFYEFVSQYDPQGLACVVLAVVGMVCLAVVLCVEAWAGSRRRKG